MLFFLKNGEMYYAPNFFMVLEQTLVHYKLHWKSLHRTFRKMLNAILGQAVYPWWWPSLIKDYKQDQFVLGVVWQTQSILCSIREKNIQCC